MPRFPIARRSTVLGYCGHTTGPLQSVVEEKSVSRPYVQLIQTETTRELRRHVDAVLPRIAALHGVIGVTLNGGLSRGYADELSEIDLTIFLEPETFARWQSGEAPLPSGITRLDGRLYDIRVADLHAETEKTWSTDALWDASYAEVLFDPDNRITAMLREKLSQSPEPAEAERDMFASWWHWRLTCDAWIHRGDAVAGHHMLNDALVALTRALFLANREYPPHEKWLLHMSRTLEWQPRDWSDRLGEAVLTGDGSIDALRRRQAAVGNLWEEIDDHLRRACGNLPVHLMQRSFFVALQTLAARGSVPISEWEAIAPSAWLSADPFFPLVEVQDGEVRLDREAFQRLSPETMYEWHFQIVDAVRDT